MISVYILSVCKVTEQLIQVYIYLALKSFFSPSPKNHFFPALSSFYYIFFCVHCIRITAPGITWGQWPPPLRAIFWKFDPYFQLFGVWNGSKNSLILISCFKLTICANFLKTFYEEVGDKKKLEIEKWEKNYD